MIKYKHILGMADDNPYANPKTAQKSIKLPQLVAASQDAAATANLGNIYFDVTGSTVKYSDGANWQDISITAGVGTLQQVTTAGATSDVVSLRFSGSAASATAFGVGGAAANDKVVIYHNATDGHINTLAGDLHLEPAGGDVSITGNCAVSVALTAASANIGSGAGVFVAGASTLASCSVTGAFSAGSFAVDAVAASTAAASLSLDGNGAGGVHIGHTSTGAISLDRAVNIAASMPLTIAGVGASNEFVITAGDAVMSDGSLSITDADNASSLVLINNTFAAGSLVDISGSGVVTGNMVAVTADNLTAGNMVYLQSSSAGFAGQFLKFSDGADIYTVGLKGATVIAGTAEGTSAITCTLGDLKLSGGVIDEDATGDNANVFTRACAATTKDFVQILCTNASDDHCALSVIHSGTAGVPAAEFSSAGTAEALRLSNTKTDGSCLNCLVGVAASVDPAVVVDGLTNNWIGAANTGMIDVICDGALAQTTSTLVRLAYSGAPAQVSSMGTCFRIEDAGSVASAVAFYISAATGEAFKVDVGKSYFDEGVLVGDGGVGYVSSNGAQDLVLRTNEGADSGAITITDAANGNIALDCNGSGRVSIPGPAVHATTTQFYNSFIIRKNWSHADPDVNNDIVICNANSPKMHVIDAWMDMGTAEGGAMTVTLRDAAAGIGNAITNAMDANVTTLSRATTLSTVALAANSSIVANFSGNPGTAAGVIYIACIEVE